MDFLKKEKRISFKIGEKDIWSTNFDITSEQNGSEIISIYRFESGIKVTNKAKKYEKYGAYEWVNYIENESDMPTEIISELWDCDCVLPMEHEDPANRSPYIPNAETATKIYAPLGSKCNNKDFYSEIDISTKGDALYHLKPHQKKEFSTSGGRSSEKNAPFFNVNKNSSGYIFAIGWSGQWKCEIAREEDSISFKSKIEDTYFRLMPKEKIRTSSVVIMPYENGAINAQNKWRRLVKEHFSLIGKQGRDDHGPLCAGIWGGMKTSSVTDRIEKIKKHNLPFEYVWMDAGWYGEKTKPTPDEYDASSDSWYLCVGDWRVSPIIHPNGLKDVSEKIHEAGMKFLLWIEIERAIRTTPAVLTHPEYFLADNDADNFNRLVNLGNPDAWEYCFSTLAGLIEDLKIDCYRQDFNIEPLEYWRKNDDPDRCGITEIKHINGLYMLWDKLLERFPNLIIDNCSSGGRRIDIETLRRSIPLWRSDVQCAANYDIEATQNHHLTYNTWMPYSGTGSGRIYDEYRIRSAYSPAITTNYSFSESENFCDTEDKIEFIKKYTHEYLRVRPYFCEDFYPLSSASDRSDVWCASQFDRPENKDGIVQVFRRENSPYETVCYFLYGIDEDGEYVFEDADGGEFVISGSELTQNGLRLTLPKKCSAKIYFYHY